VQALLGPESVVTAVLVGGRDPAERVRLVPWGDTRDGAGAADPGVSAVEVAPSGPGAAPSALDGPPELWAVPEGAGPPVPLAAGAADVFAPGVAPDRAPAGWPPDVVRATGRVPATAPLDTDPAPPARPTNRRRRPPARRSTPSTPTREPPPPWPGRLPAPSPATVLPRPEPIGVVDGGGRPVRLVEPDRLSAPPARLVAGGPRGDRAVAGWAGPWPVQQRWWAGGGGTRARVQVLCDDGTAHLLVVADDRWWVVGVYD
jgi:protein ImuB